MHSSMSATQCHQTGSFRPNTGLYWLVPATPITAPPDAPRGFFVCSGDFPDAPPGRIGFSLLMFFVGTGGTRRSSSRPSGSTRIVGDSDAYEKRFRPPAYPMGSRVVKRPCGWIQHPCPHEDETRLRSCRHPANPRRCPEGIHRRECPPRGSSACQTASTGTSLRSPPTQRRPPRPTPTRSGE